MNQSINQSYLILSYPILSYFILSYLILSDLILSILSYLILSYLILSYLIIYLSIYLSFYLSIYIYIYYYKWWIFQHVTLAEGKSGGRAGFLVRSKKAPHVFHPETWSQFLLVKYAYWCLVTINNYQ